MFLGLSHVYVYLELLDFHFRDLDVTRYFRPLMVDFHDALLIIQY